MKISRFAKKVARFLFKFASFIFVISIISIQIHAILRIAQGGNMYTQYLVEHIDQSCLYTFAAYFFSYIALKKDKKDNKKDNIILLEYLTATLPSFYLTTTYLFSGAFFGSIPLKLFLTSIILFVTAFYLVFVSNLDENKELIKKEESLYYNYEYKEFAN